MFTFDEKIYIFWNCPLIVEDISRVHMNRGDFLDKFGCKNKWFRLEKGYFLDNRPEDIFADDPFSFIGEILENIAVLEDIKTTIWCGAKPNLDSLKKFLLQIAT